MSAAFLAILMLFLSRPAGAEDLLFQSGPSQNTLVLLFTSDANASCNPALDWMSAQKDKDPVSDLWARFVPVAMHVKHWDAMGYRDAFAKDVFEEMLLAHQRLWSASNVYPPTVAANGDDWAGWARGQDVPSNRDKETGVLTVRTSFEQQGPGEYSAEFTPSKKLEGGSFTLHGCLLAFGLSSKPWEGRNRGHTLKHDFIAMSYQSQDFLPSESFLGASVVIPLPKIGIPRAPRYAMVFWVTKKGSVTPVQATGGFLPQP